MNDHRVAVIGAGISGLLSAWYLARAGLAVTVFERGDSGRESSWAGGGILSPLYPWRYSDALSALVRESLRLYPELLAAVQRLSGVDPQWEPSGLLFLAPEDPDQAEAWAARQGMALSRVPGERVAQIEPLARPLAEDCIWMPEVGQLRNPRLMQALRGAVLASGVELREHSGECRLWLQAGRLCGVESSRHGRLPMGRVVIACGAWSPALFAGWDWSPPIEPVRGQMLLLRGAPGRLRRMLLEGGRYLIPRRDGHILIGSTLERVGFDRGITAAAREDLHQALRRIAPGLADLPVVKQWSGLRPGSPDETPYIGPHPGVEGVFVNAGHYRNGIILGAGAADLLARQVLGEPVPPALQPLLPQGRPLAAWG